MNHSENPFQPPTNPGQKSTGMAINWGAFWLLNIGIVIALAAFILISLAPVYYADQQQLGRRYATYDHEITHHIYPTGALIALFLILAITNFLFFATQILRRKNSRQ